MSTRQWTYNQEDAIEARGGTLLVSAAAGSGKTAVLVQRVIERITDTENPTNADRLLVVTFTKAAAAEMQSRIASEISYLLEKDPMNVNLQRQQILLTRSHISTIHSFCSELIKENFYKLGIAPDFRIIEDTEMQLLRSDAFESVLEDFYSSGDIEFLNLVETFSTGRDDVRIIKAVNNLYDFVRSHPFPKRWLKDKANMYKTGNCACDTVWGKTLLSYGKDVIDYSISLTQNSLKLMEEDEKIEQAYSEGFNSDLAGLSSLKEEINSKNWDNIKYQTNNFTYKRLKSLRGYKDDPLKNKIQSSRKEVQSAIKKLASLFSETKEQCGEDINKLSPIMDKLVEVTEKFGEKLEQLKKERHAADFSDLEHYAIKLLINEKEDGFEPTQDALEISSMFDEVMVDEYQDTNEAQDMIFRAVSRNEKNLFMVGDVKQSIYRFRQAMPQIFLRRRELYPNYERSKDEYPACVVLDKNFRSRKGVTETVNFVFRQLMSKQTGELDYTEEEELKAGADYPRCEETSAQLDIIDLSSIDDNEDKDMIKAESRHIADVIYQLTTKPMMVTDNGEQRPVVYKDICILLRSANKYAHQYAKQLESVGIPAWADTGGSFFGSKEIGIIISMLRIIDNPMQDIPLLAVMMSPIYGFTADDMADIRKNSRNSSLYLAVVKAATGYNYNSKKSDENPKAESNLNDRVSKFLKEIDEYRTLSATMPCDRLIHYAYEKSGYLNIVQAMSNSELRIANLRLLLEYAKKYEKSGSNGLTGFINFIDRLQKNNSDLAAASTISEAANVVKIMSIHRSKGLEFPVCIIAGCARKFNKDSGDILLHPELGLGVKLKDIDTLNRYTTMPREAIALELDRGEMSEELRILYVAMTRAKEKLIMVSAVKDAVKTFGKLANRITSESKIQPYVVRSADSISDWLILCALRHPNGERLRQLAGALPGVTVSANVDWSINLIRENSKDIDENIENNEKVIEEKPDEKIKAEILSNINYMYPYSGLKGIQAKVSASHLAASKFSDKYAAVSRPAFLNKTGLTPAERGTALHTYIQFADFKKASEDPQAEINRLVSEGYLTKEQGNAVSLKNLEKFFNSNIAKRILDSPRVVREYRFIVEITAGDINPELSDELKNQQVVLQGAVDCAFEENGEIVIVDFKTDKSGSGEELWDKYSSQLLLYKLAMEKCTEKTVKECLLYSFGINKEITK
jgi:ATP-dependent helicase/nuclease subunit A